MIKIVEAPVPAASTTTTATTTPASSSEEATTATTQDPPAATKQPSAAVATILAKLNQRKAQQIAEQTSAPATSTTKATSKKPTAQNLAPPATKAAKPSAQPQARPAKPPPPPPRARLTPEEHRAAQVKERLAVAPQVEAPTQELIELYMELSASERIAFDARTKIMLSGLSDEERYGEAPHWMVPGARVVVTGGKKSFIGLHGVIYRVNRTRCQINLDDRNSEAYLLFGEFEAEAGVDGLVNPDDGETSDNILDGDDAVDDSDVVADVATIDEGANAEALGGGGGGEDDGDLVDSAVDNAASDDEGATASDEGVETGT